MNMYLKENMKNGLLFLARINNPATKIWYKKGARVGIRTINHSLKNIVEDAHI